MAEAPLIGKREFEHSGPVIRLLLCFVCNSIDELPPHDGPSETDILLEMTVEKHEFPSGLRHQGKMFILPVKVWANTSNRKEIINQLKGTGVTGLDAMTEEGDFYSTKMQFAEDAMSCYTYHLRPEDNCADYRTESKRLLPKTAKERKSAGLEAPKDAALPKIYLCNFCPMQSVIVTKQRAMRGMYN
jgi:hypothetical protein